MKKQTKNGLPTTPTEKQTKTKNLDEETQNQTIKQQFNRYPHVKRESLKTDRTENIFDAITIPRNPSLQPSLSANHFDSAEQNVFTHTQRRKQIDWGKKQREKPSCRGFNNLSLGKFALTHIVEKRETPYPWYFEGFIGRDTGVLLFETKAKESLDN